MPYSETLQLTTPSLPSGGGAITGLKGDIAGAGPDGAATLSVPLPITAGRGYAPSLSLTYHSRAGNGPFGMGWNIRLPIIRRRTFHGAPNYDDTDEFTGPDGEVLVPILTETGAPETRQATSLLDISFSDPFIVHGYRSRTETDFSRLERWVPEKRDEQDFWVLYSTDGQVCLLGHHPQARITNPAVLTQTAAWLIESSVSSTGEQIYYQYRPEDDIGCDDEEKTVHPDVIAEGYLTAVWYGNKNAGRTLPGLHDSPSAEDWLFTLVFDYGERDTDLAKEPDWVFPGQGDWLCRQDCFSGYEYGFNLRTRRLCRQVLMYHAVAALAGEEGQNETPTLISRMWLSYEENPSVTTLKTIQQMAYEPDGSRCSLPPLSFGWQTFSPPQTVSWQLREDMENLNPQHPYQMVDLNGEGLAGILYQDNGGWWYRAPMRQAGETPDAVTWGKAAPLPAIPALRDGGILADLNGDGYLEWLVTLPGGAGHYERTPEGGWRHFTPLSALPAEYTHPRAQLVDIIGAGLADLALIGPKSVRLYAGKGDGWAAGRTILQPDITLPSPDTNAHMLIAFSDMVGSGQQHLVEVRADGVRYWPNLGHGRFAPAIDLPGFSQPAPTFNPSQLYLADIDGSGTTDLIYAFADRILVYRNLSGNRFADPFTVHLPEGAHYDRTCRLQLADIQGLGMASLVLTIPHPTPRHWVCHLSATKPWLLNAMNNNMGGRHLFHFRSSAQFWLDEKAETQAAGKTVPFCYLPFALHTLHRQEIIDDITGNHLVSAVRYRHGVWDGREREFRGFGYVEISDTDMLSSRGTAKEISMPSLDRRWYATGLPAVDMRLPEEYWQGDDQAFAGFTPRFTAGDEDNEKTYFPEEATRYWLHRGMKGMQLRNEIYGADASNQSDIPYSLTESRPQIRLVEERGRYPVIWGTAVESRTYIYERIMSDPQCHQQVLLASDKFGSPLRQVNIDYPRRPPLEESPYPYSLPETLFSSSYDEQQHHLRLTLSHSCWHHQIQQEQGVWLHGLTDASRRDIFIHPASSVPADGLTLELLADIDSLIGENHPYTFAGQQQVWYEDQQDNPVTEMPAFPPRMSFTEMAVLDDDMVTTLSNDISTDDLVQAGYTASAYLFAHAAEAEKTLWATRQQYVHYASASHFWLPTSTRNTLLTGVTTFNRDQHHCVITQVTDAAGLTTSAEYDWRFLVPVRLTDANSNIQAVKLDALGRVLNTRFFGSEEGSEVGYSDAVMVQPETVDEALALSAPLPVYHCMVYVADSWKSDAVEKLPPHVLTLVTDRYDNDDEQQIRQQIAFCDGFGRVLQTAIRQVEGTAWQRTQAGGLSTHPDGSLVSEETDFRWAVTGRTEYDNKGQAIRTYQPYFLDSWKYVGDDSARQDLYADTHYYDPVGREWQVKTAKGGLQRRLFTPWFSVSEDENDTASESESTR